MMEISETDKSVVITLNILLTLRIILFFQKKQSVGQIKKKIEIDIRTELNWLS